MFVVFANLWNAGRATGHDRLLVDAWFELVADDTSPLYWPPLCSTLQLFRNLRQTLTDVGRGILKTYHVKDGATELLDRLKLSPWLEEEYPGDIVFLKEHLVRLRDSHKEKDTPETPDEKKGREGGQKDVRAAFNLLLGAFIDKVERDRPLERQRERLARLAANTDTSFDVVVRAAAELTNDLLHIGHSREHLHRWMLNGVLGPGSTHPYLQDLREAAGLGKGHEGQYQVVFRVFATTGVPNFGAIVFTDAIPGTLGVPAGSMLRSISHGRYAIVTVGKCLDPFAAIDQARGVLKRYLASTRLEDHVFDRTISAHAAAHHVGTGTVSEVQDIRTLMTRSLRNDGIFYGTPEKDRNEQTFGELDRVLYWLEQSRQWDDMGRLTALWTAMEFLFSRESSAGSEPIIDILPAYLVPRYPRLLLLDFAIFFSKMRVEVAEPLLTRVKASSLGRGGYRLGDLTALLEVAQEKAETDPMLQLVAGMPVLVRKWRKVRRLNPTLKGVTSSAPDIWNDIDGFESNLTFDLQYSYRARNSIVHDAATSVVQSDRLVQRLHWMLCTALEGLFYQFSRNPTLSLAALHAVNRTSYQRWRKALKDEKNPVSLKDIFAPPVSCIL